MNIVGYAGIDFESLGFHGGLPWSTARGQWTVQPSVTTRVNNVPVIGPGAVTARAIDVEIVITEDATDDLRLAIDRLIGLINPLDQTKRPLRAVRYDGTYVTRDAVATLPSGYNSGVNIVLIRFISEDPKWLKETPVTVSTPIAGDGPVLPLPNSGQAHVHAVYKITPDTVRTTKTADIGWSNRKTLELTNTGTKTITNHAYRLDLGDTKALVTAGKMLANGDDLRILLNGENVRRNLIGINTEQTFLWFVISSLAAGESIEYEIVYGNNQAGTASTMPRRSKPVFDIGGENGAATGGSTTVLNNSGATWEAGRWKDAALYILSGANAGQVALITNNTPTQLQFAALPNAIASGVRYVISMSRNGKWVYATRQTDRGSDTARGRWYVSSGEAPPEETLYGNDAVGAWSRELYYDNRDKKGQRRWTRVTVGGDPDTFTMLDAYRTYDTGPTVPEEGVADGVVLSLPFPITAVDATLQFKNPNAICKAFFGGKSSAGDDWEEIDSDVAAHAALTDWTINESGLSYYHIYQGIIPHYDDEIGTIWKGDTGSTSSAGSTTTTNDATKAWYTDQFKGGVIRFKSGALAGKVQAITGNSGTQITHGAFGSATPEGSSYEIIGADLLANLVDKDRLVVTFDDSTLTQSLSGEHSVFQHSGELWIGGGSLANPQPHPRVRIGQDGRMVFTEFSPDLEALVLNSETRTATIQVGSTIVRYLTDPAIVWEYGLFDDYVKAAGGMPVPIGANQLTNPTAASNATGWSVVASAGITVDPVDRVTGTYFDAAGSFRIPMTTNVASAGATVDLISDAFIAIQPSQVVSFFAGAKNLATNFTVRLGFKFYDAAQSLISTVPEGAGTAALDWHAETFVTDAPATARYCKPFVRFTDTVGGSVSNLYVDAMDLGSPWLQFLDDVVDAPILLEATYTEGFLG